MAEFFPQVQIPEALMKQSVDLIYQKEAARPDLSLTGGLNTIAEGILGGLKERRTKQEGLEKEQREQAGKIEIAGIQAGKGSVLFTEQHSQSVKLLNPELDFSGLVGTQVPISFVNQFISGISKAKVAEEKVKTDKEKAKVSGAGDRDKILAGIEDDARAQAKTAVDNLGFMPRMEQKVKTYNAAFVEAYQKLLNVRLANASDKEKMDILTNRLKQPIQLPFSGGPGESPVVQGIGNLSPEIVSQFVQRIKSMREENKMNDRSIAEMLAKPPTRFTPEQITQLLKMAQ